MKSDPSIRVENLSLEYRVGRKLSLSGIAGSILRRHNRAPHKAVGGTIKALHDINFDLRSGDRLGLVGVNGSGKSTLLKVLYGIYEPAEGHVHRSGRVDALFNINLGFRRDVSGRKNIMLRGLVNGWSEEQIKRKTPEIIAFSELEEFIDLPLKVYSQGMAARLAFSIATALDPEILLLDEWIGAGDPGFQEKARERMKNLAAKAGIVVLASHNKVLIKNTCNRILELDKGRMKRLLTIDEWS